MRLITAFLTVLVYLLALAPPAPAQVPPPTLSKKQAGFYRMQIGDFEVIALSDGTIRLPVLEILTNTEPGQVEKLLAYAYQKSPIDASVNAFVIVAGDRLILVDSGTGELFGPALKKLPASLEAAGYKPEQITDILLTHIHTDHSGGLIDGDKFVFPNATLHVQQRELDFWLDPAGLKNAPEGMMKLLFQQAFAKVKPYVDAKKVKTFDRDGQLFPGIRTVATPGHTPGHTFYVLESKGEKIVFWGDILHIGDVQFPHPSITITFDVDSKAAAVQRKKAFADAAEGGYLVAPAHVSFPGVGRLRAEGNGYRWIPVPYINDAHEVKQSR